jgi:Flp pilus assembly protein, ATPase CpaF
MIEVETLYHKVLESIDLSQEVDDAELMNLITHILREEEQKSYITLKEKIRIGRELFNAFRKLNILQELVEDPEITEIMINGTENIFVEKEGALCCSEKRFLSKSRLEDVAQQIVSETNRMVNEAMPIADARLKDGSRVNIVLPPIALNGPIITIRKFSKEPITMNKLIQMKSINEEVAVFLKRLICAKYNIFISGGTGSGKTTFLNALAEYIPQEERIITIEDNAELQIRNIPNLVKLEARTANVEGEGEITIRRLIWSALRMRPTRIIVGEVRGVEAMDMLQAMNTGHDGSMSTGHANSSEDMLSRLETMVLMGMEIPLPAIQRQIASAIDIIVHLGRTKDKSRKVLEIKEVLRYEDGEIKLQSLFKYEGELIKQNEMVYTEKLLASGY